ncbi:LTA synthase family protein [bacterium]|nr:LTA synthase family protein [bacterium]
MIRHVLKYFLFLLGLFIWSRVLFLIVNSDQFWVDLFRIPIIQYHALKLDLSVMGYFTLFPFIVAAVATKFENRNSDVLRLYVKILASLVWLVLIIDPFYYKYFGLKVNLMAIQYADDAAGWSSIAFMDYFWFFVFLIWGLRKIYRKSEEFRFLPISGTWIGIVIAGAFIVYSVRGGFDKSTVGVSSAYYSNRAEINACAVNPVWNLVSYEINRDAIHAVEELEIPEFKLAFDKESIDPEEYLSVNDSTNVILVVLESVNLKGSKWMSSEVKAMPFIEKLSEESLNYSHCYAHSFRSDKGLAALLHGLPAVSRVNPADFPELLGDNLFSSFNQKGYSSQLVYGGDLNFANIKVLAKDARSLISSEDFQQGEQNAWGYHDPYIYDKALEQQNGLQKPFFQTIYTISAHEPYDVPKYNEVDDPYLNAVSYTDRSLEDFVRNLKANNKWENTLLIVTSDHGSVQPNHAAAPESENYRIPMLLTGGVVKKYETIDHVVSQLDLAGTLKVLFNLDLDPVYDGTLFQPKGMAFYNYYDGLASVTKVCEQWYDLPLEKYLKGPCNSPYEKLFFKDAHREFFRMKN